MPTKFFLGGFLGNLERTMQTPSFFAPRGGGKPRGYKYTAAACDCRYCVHAPMPRTRCGISMTDCPCFTERLETGCIPLTELLASLTQDIRYRGLQTRINDLIAEREAAEMFFVSGRHKALFNSVIKQGGLRHSNDTGIGANPEWELADIFADEGISGTNAKKRPEFLKLMELCKRGKVDMVLAKSISRFARNTVDCLSYIRMLKEMNITVIFEKEGVNTAEMTSELMISFMSAFAQAESESLSMNVTWGKRRSFQNGKVSFQYSRFYGYEKGEDEQPKIVPEQAAVVRRIFHTYLAGYSLKQIKSELERENVPSSTGKSEWSVHSLQYMIRNEKYIGDAILQKTYMVDFMTKKTRKNNGEVPKYYISNNHSPIVERHIFNQVQEEIARRAGKRKVSQKATRTEHGKYSGKYALSELLVCGDCGSHYRRVTWARGGVKRIVWRCINRLEHGTKFCKESPTIEEIRLHDAIMDAFNRLEEDKADVLATLRESIEYALNCGQLSDNSADIQSRIKELQSAMLDLIKASVQSGAEQHDAEFKALSEEIATLQTQLQDRNQSDSDRQDNRSRLDEMLNLLEWTDFAVSEYDDALVRRSVEWVTVIDADRILVKFKWGAEYEVALW